MPNIQGGTAVACSWANEETGEAFTPPHMRLNMQLIVHGLQGGFSSVFSGRSCIRLWQTLAV
jgi:hypothetical protein